MELFTTYIDKAKKMGALEAKVIKASDIVIDPRTLIKCMFGCDTWGKHWTCPSAPGALKPWEFEEILKRYKYGILIHSETKKLAQDISFKLESDAFVDGYYFAFSMADCGLCTNCIYPDTCKHPEKARPAMQALGIDVFATARMQNMPIETLANKEDEPNWYSLVLIE
jgi:predicted metal-binding protein